MSEHKQTWRWLSRKLSEPSADMLVDAYVLYHEGNLDLRLTSHNDKRVAFVLASMGLFDRPSMNAYRPTVAGNEVALCIVERRR